MRANGFELREFRSLDEYLAQDEKAKLWYFTRLQLERMGDLLLPRVDGLRAAVSVRQDMIPKLLPGTRFYHPLPRDSHNPTIPFWLDNTEYNNWDMQSRNGYYVRIALMGLLFGGPSQSMDASGGAFLLPPVHDAEAGARSGEAYSPKMRVQPPVPLFPSGEPDDFVEEMPLSPTSEKGTSKGMTYGILPITDGVVIDHISKGSETKTIWRQITRVRGFMGFLGCIGASGVYPSSKSGRMEAPKKGLISLPLIQKEFDRKALKKLAALAPGCTVNIITDSKVQRKFRLHMPPRIYNFPSIQCANTNCVSHPGNMQREVQPHFIRPSRDRVGSSATVFLCLYCDRAHHYWEIWRNEDI
jgi:aspartate carbamoyltransferase